MKEKPVQVILAMIVLSLIAAGVNSGTLNLVPVFSPQFAGTITDVTCRAEFTGDGSTTTFTFTFPIIQTSDIKLYHRVIATGVTTLLTETTNYSIAATNNDFSSGGVITTVSTYASTVKLIAIRDIPDSQNATLSDSGVLRLAAIEDALDKLTMLHEQQQEEIDRCLKFPPSDLSSLSAELPNSVDRASETLVFSSNGTPTTE